MAKLMYVEAALSRERPAPVTSGRFSKPYPSVEELKERRDQSTRLIEGAAKGDRKPQPNMKVTRTDLKEFAKLHGHNPKFLREK